MSAIDEGKPKGLILTINDPSLLSVTCEVITDSGCTYSLLPEPEQPDVTLIVVSGTVTQLRACYNTGHDERGLW
jgi:hypothetical protein